MKRDWSKILMVVFFFAMLYFYRGWKRDKMQTSAWGNSPFALSASDNNCDLFASDGFIVLQVAESNTDIKELSYKPFGSLAAGKNRSMFGGVVKVEGFPAFVAIPGNVYFMLDGRIFKCPSEVKKDAILGDFGQIIKKETPCDAQLSTAF